MTNADEKLMKPGPAGGPEDHMKDRIRETREARGLSQSDLHRKTGLSRTVLAGYESGKHKPGARELRMICDVLEISPTYLIYGSEEPFKKRPGLASLLGLKSQGAAAAQMAFMMPTVFAMLQEGEKEALLTLVGALLRARDPKAMATFEEMIAVMSDAMGSGSPDEIQRVIRLSTDPTFLEEAQRRIKRASDGIKGD